MRLHCQNCYTACCVRYFCSKGYQVPCADEQFLQELERNVPAKVNKRMFPGHGFEMILIV